MPDLQNTSTVPNPAGNSVPNTPAGDPLLTKPKEVPGKEAAGTPVEPKKEAVSPKINALIRRERQALEREQNAKTSEAKLQAREEALKAREARVEEFETIKTTNPKKAREMLGLTYDQITQIELLDGQIPPEVQVKNVEDKLTKLTEEMRSKELATAEAQKVYQERQEEQAREEFQREIGSYLDTNAKEYQLIQFEGQQALVYAVIDEHYSRTVDEKTGVGKIMSIKEASDKVETHLKEKYKKAVELETVKGFFKAPEVPKPKFEVERPLMPRPKPQTLTNNMSAQPQRPRTSPLSDEERIAKAIAYARGLRA